MRNPRQILNFFLVLGQFNQKSYNIYFPDNGIASLASSIRHSGHNVLYFDTNIDDESLLIKAIQNMRPEIIGFKIFYNNLFASIKLAEKIKQIHPDCLIIAGGPQVSLYRDVVYDVTEVFDFLVIGEGEKAIIEIGEYFLQKRSIAKIRNVIFKRNGCVSRNPVKAITDIDEIPLPDWSVIKLSSYFPVLQLNMSRGCPHQCSFCVHNAVLSRCNEYTELCGKSRVDISKENLVRTRRFARVKEELMNNIQKFNVKLFVFPDSTPSMRMLDRLSSFIISNKLEINWAAFARIGIFKEEFYQKIARAGCVCLFFGIESGSALILQKIGKGYTKEETVNSIEWASRHGIRTIGSFIMGFPGENKQTIEETKNLISELKLDTIFMSPFELELGSPISFTPGNYNIVLHEDWMQKTILLPAGIDSHEIKFYYINGQSNDLWWAKIKKQYNLEESGIELDIFDNEYIKLLAYKMKMSSKGLFKKINLLIADQDKRALRSFISECWQVCCE